MAAAGLEPDKHLGMTIAEVAPTLFALDKKFGSHVCGEGGEYETFVLDCPMFKAKIVLEETRWCRPRFFRPFAASVSPCRVAQWMHTGPA